MRWRAARAEALTALDSTTAAAVDRRAAVARAHPPFDERSFGAAAALLAVCGDRMTSEGETVIG